MKFQRLVAAFALMALAMLAGCVEIVEVPSQPVPRGMTVSFDWGNNAGSYMSPSPELRLTNVPYGTALLDISMVDLSNGVDHGGGVIPYDGNNYVAVGSLRNYRGPQQVDGSVHTYEIRVRALSADRSQLLAEARSTNVWPQNYNQLPQQPQYPQPSQRPMALNFEWGGNAGSYSSPSPALRLENVPYGTEYLDISMVDLNNPRFDHGGGIVPYARNNVVPEGAIRNWRGPQHSDRNPHQYEITVKALSSDQRTVLAEVKASRPWPDGWQGGWNNGGNVPQPGNRPISVTFEWGNNAGVYMSPSPEIWLSNIPSGTAYLDVQMRDLDNPSFEHGGGIVPYNNNNNIPRGALRNYRGPQQIWGSHTYEITVKALASDQRTVLGQGSTTRRYP